MVNHKRRYYAPPIRLYVLVFTMGLSLASLGWIDFAYGGAYARGHWRSGGLWQKRKLKSASIRDAIVRRRRAASIAERTARVLRTGRRSRATAGIWSVAPARRGLGTVGDRMAQVFVG